MSILGAGPRPRWAPSLAALVSLCLAAGACGSNDVTASDAAASDAPASEGEGPEYGASLDEWSEATGAAQGDGSAAPSDQVPGDEYETFEWEDLIPAGQSGDDIYARFADRLDAVEDGSPEADVLYEEMQAEYNAVEVNDELDGTKIQLAGFVAPLTYDDDIVTEFLLVPYFGACIHVPPPPPHQTILVTVDKANGFTIDESWGAIWVAGTLTVSSATTDLATAGYTITDATSGVYDDY
ncbi:MAG: DUF3299 domain-containing protein [Acidimicrobiales bacterium]